MGTADKLDRICYKKNFLTAVIVRFDFSSNVEELTEGVPAALEKLILKTFNVKEDKEILEGNLVISKQKTAVEQKSTYKNWTYYNKSRSRFVEISKKHVAISFEDYDRFEELRDVLGLLSVRLYECIGSAIVRRIGLRYINEIRIDTDGAPTNWKGVINSKLIAGFDYFAKMNLSRLFSQCVISHDNFNVLFQYGMHNPDFPSVIKQKVFILDFDAYSEGVIEKDDVCPHVDGFHREIQKLFESSIGARLRTIMGCV